MSQLRSLKTVNLLCVCVHVRVYLFLFGMCVCVCVGCMYVCVCMFLFVGSQVKRSARMCGECEPCRRTEDCAQCDFCKDMKKFWGPNKNRFQPTQTSVT